MTDDRESSNIEAAAYLARGDNPGADDRPTKAEADRDEWLPFVGGPSVKTIWTPTDHGYDEEAGW